MSHFQHLYYGKPGIINRFDLELVPPFSTPVSWETPHYPYVGGPGIPLSTPSLWETYAVVNGPTVTRLPFSTPILRETRAHPSWLSMYASAFQHPSCGKLACFAAKYVITSYLSPLQGNHAPSFLRYSALSTPIQGKPCAESL
jgi:hypothetical protein